MPKGKSGKLEEFGSCWIGPIFNFPMKEHSPEGFTKEEAIELCRQLTQEDFQKTLEQLWYKKVTIDGKTGYVALSHRTAELPRLGDEIYGLTEDTSLIPFFRDICTNNNHF